mgnify:CR=1 FL=1
MEFVLPIKTVNESNGSHGHWSVKSQRRASHRTAVWGAMSGKVLPGLPVVVTLTRIGAGELDPHDNLPGSFKAVADQIAEQYGIADKDKRLGWQYAQEKAKRGTYGVRVRIETRGET